MSNKVIGKMSFRDVDIEIDEYGWFSCKIERKEHTSASYQGLCKIIRQSQSWVMVPCFAVTHPPHINKIYIEAVRANGYIDEGFHVYSGMVKITDCYLPADETAIKEILAEYADDHKLISSAYQSQEHDLNTKLQGSLSRFPNVTKEWVKSERVRLRKEKETKVGRLCVVEGALG